MKKIISLLILLAVASLLFACAPAPEQAQIAATTRPVYEFTTTLCEGTGITVGLLVTESVSCLHDYSLQTRQMRLLEGADLLVISGAGLEDFLELGSHSNVCDASVEIALLCPGDDSHEEEHDHHHESDPHIWLDPENAKLMAQNICSSLCHNYPQHEKLFLDNLEDLTTKLDALDAYGMETLSELNSRQIITFHDGFGYFAEAFDLTILESVEEESGSEASAKELISLISQVNQHQLPAIFIEANGSVSAADIISAETGAGVFVLDMGMGDKGYFDTMYHNIDTIKEALG